MKKLHLYFSLRLIAISLFFSCAQVVAPTGGERDNQPPTVLDLKPQNESVNFTTDKIEITFDEFIRLNNLKEQLIVSPPLKYNLESKISGKTLQLKIKDTLKTNTTYVFNFGDAIVDITENNPISNFQYVFSTGNSIDTLVQKGQVVDAFTLKLQEDFLVMLYSNPSDSVPLKELPDYIGRTNKNGEFLITNIKKGKYKIFALKDANKNYLFDRPDELIAFRKKTIIISATPDSITLYAFLEDKEKQFIKEQVERGPQLILDFNRKTEDFKYSLIENNSSILKKQILSSTKDSAIFWWKEMPETKTRLVISDKTFVDTITVKIDSISKKSKLKFLNPLIGKQNYFRPLTLQFNRPIEKHDVKKIKVYDTDSTSIPFIIEKDKKDATVFTIKFPIKEEMHYNLQVFPEAFIDIYSKTTDTLISNFSFNQASDFGTLLVKVKSENNAKKIIQLTNTKGKIVQEKPLDKNGVVTFNHIVDGKYRLKLIYDQNGNGKWDTGNYIKSIQAEKTFLFDEDITIRENWDKELEWRIK